MRTLSFTSILLSVFLVIAGCGGGGGGGGGGGTADTTAPAVSIVSPGQGDTCSGIVSVDIIASDAVGVTKVEFYVNSVLMSTKTSSPYTFSWNTTSLVNGNSYILSAKAYDGAGNSSTSGSVTVTVNNTVSDTIAPVVSITSPSDSDVVNGLMTVVASASDNVGVSRVELYVDGSLSGTADTSFPFQFSWNATAGSHQLEVKAYDAANNSTTSSVVTVLASSTIAIKARSVAASSVGILGIDMVVRMPAGVSFSSAAASGVAAGSTLSSNVAGQDLSISILSQNLIPFGLGEFLTVNAAVSSGAAISPSDFSIVSFGPFDGSGSVISGVTAELYR